MCDPTTFNQQGRCFTTDTTGAAGTCSSSVCGTSCIDFFCRANPTVAPTPVPTPLVVAAPCRNVNGGGCLLPSGLTGACSANGICAAQCGNVKRQSSQPQLCFARSDSTSLDGTCQFGRCLLTTVAPTPRPTPTAQPTVAPTPAPLCRNVNSGCSLSNGLTGACSANFVCVAQCGNVKRQLSLPQRCFALVGSTSLDGTCQNGRCLANATFAPTPSPPTLCTNAGGACALGDSIGQCSRSGICTPQCGLVKRQDPSFGAACFLTLSTAAPDGTCQNGRCVRPPTPRPTPRPTPSPTPSPTCRNINGACLLSNGLTGACSQNGACVAQCGNVKRQLLSPQTCFAQINSTALDGVCQSGRCVPNVVLPVLCANAGGACPLGNAVGLCSRSGICTPQCGLVKRQDSSGAPCFLTLTAAPDGTCQNGRCTRPPVLTPRPTPPAVPIVLCRNIGGGCDLRAGVVGACSRVGVCSAQCGNVKRQDASLPQPCFAQSNSTALDGVCARGFCLRNTPSPTPAPFCAPSRPCRLASSGIATTFGICSADGSRCDTQCRDPAQKACFLSTASNVPDGVCSALGLCERPLAPVQCGTGAQFCLFNNTVRGFCNGRECAAIECTSTCSDANKVCQAFRCIDRVTTPDLCAAVRCQNGGRCQLVDAARAGFNTTQVMERTDVVYADGARAAVCACPAGFTGRLCEEKMETPPVRPVCRCASDAVEKDGFCVSRNSRICDCSGQRCRCGNGSTKDDCSLSSVPVVDQRRVLLTAIFSANRTTLLQALSVVQSLLSQPGLKLIITAETLADSQLKITVETEGTVDASIIKQAATELGQRSDVIQASTVDSAVIKETAQVIRPASAGSLTVGVASLIVVASLFL